MKYQISYLGGNKYIVVEMRTGEVVYTGSLDLAQQAMALLNGGNRNAARDA